MKLSLLLGCRYLILSSSPREKIIHAGKFLKLDSFMFSVMLVSTVSILLCLYLYRRTIMDIILTQEEVRVLGCLVEKKMATPDYYPLSLNALLNACNQKVNREPVVNYDDDIVLRAISGLKNKKLLWQNNAGRVSKYKEGLVEEYNLADEEAAVICTLMLRGPQTIGEIRGRTERLCGFESLEEVNDTLESLISLDCVEQMARRPGQKEVRYRHLLEQAAENEKGYTPQAPDFSADRERLLLLEEKVRSLSDELETLRQEFAEFRQQFE
jgi:uncharacterized protein YceH (UPF0502 family)